MKVAVFYFAFFVFLNAACSSNKPKPAARVSHWKEVYHQDGSLLSVDPLPAKAIFESTDTSGNTRFISFLIGIESRSLDLTGKNNLQNGQYFQYRWDKDWVAIAGQDSLYPVFFEPKFKQRKDLDQAVLVFEIPASKQIDALFYRDAYGSWGNQKISF